MSDTVPCKYCGTPTRMTGTKLCDNCWEVETRLPHFLKSVNGRLYARQQIRIALSNAVQEDISEHPSDQPLAE